MDFFTASDCSECKLLEKSFHLNWKASFRTIVFCLEINKGKYNTRTNSALGGVGTLSTKRKMALGFVEYLTFYRKSCGKFKKRFCLLLWSNNDVSRAWLQDADSQGHSSRFGRNQHLVTLNSLILKHKTDEILTSLSFM